MRHLLSSLLSLVTLGACASAIAGEAKPERVELALGASAVAHGIELRFVRVVADSRCPEGVDCVWAGDAEVELEAVAAGQSQVLRLHTTLEPKEARVAGVRVLLVAVEPHPRIDERIDPADLEVVLEVGDDDAGAGAERNDTGGGKER